MNLSIIDFNHDDYWDIYITMIDMFNKHLTFQLPSDDSIINRSDKILKPIHILLETNFILAKKIISQEKPMIFLNQEIKVGDGVPVFLI